MSTKSAKLKFDSKEADFPIYQGTLGPEVIDVSQLGKQDVFTFDPGFMATAACESKITYIDGDKGILLHRGYPIDQLAEHCDFMEVAYLLLKGELPNSTEFEKFNQEIKQSINLPAQLSDLFKGFKSDAHPMAMMISAVGSLAAYYPQLMDVISADLRAKSCIQIIAQIPIIAAMCYRHNQNLPFIAPKANYSYTQNFMYMLFGDDKKDPNPVLTRALDRIFILHADHEQNASTSTVRMAGSTGTHPFAAIAAGVAALWGPAHGGANEACLNMLKEIGSESQIGKYIAKAKDKNDAFRLMGFGHRVYKNYDPRATVMRKTCYEVLQETGHEENPLFKLAMKLEKIALEDEYFVERKLYPNVDFYSGVTLSALGIPPTLFTVLFALARTSGWAAQWAEMLNDPQHKIARPRQLYTGKTERDVTPLTQRK